VAGRWCVVGGGAGLFWVVGEGGGGGGCGGWGVV